MTNMLANFAQKYAQISQWQYRRGLALIDLAAPIEGSTVVDLGCGPGKLSVELAKRVGPSGQVIAIDPDADRLREAVAAKPDELSQLIFLEGRAQHLGPVADGSADLVFSNYAGHWVLDHAAMLREIERVLKPGGRFVAEFLGQPIPLLIELVLLMPDGAQQIQTNAYRTEAEWRRLISACKVDIMRFDWPALTLDFDCLPDLYEWLEGTSNGGFQAAKLPAQAGADFAARFPGAVSCPVKALRMVLQRR